MYVSSELLSSYYRNINGRLKSLVESTNGRQIPEVTEKHSSNCSSGNYSVELIWVALLTLVHQSYFSNMLLLEKKAMVKVWIFISPEMEKIVVWK